MTLNEPKDLVRRIWRRIRADQRQVGSPPHLQVILIPRQVAVDSWVFRFSFGNVVTASPSWVTVTFHSRYRGRRAVHDAVNLSLHHQAQGYLSRPVEWSILRPFTNADFNILAIVDEIYDLSLTVWSDIRRGSEMDEIARLASKLNGCFEKELGFGFRAWANGVALTIAPTVTLTAIEKIAAIVRKDKHLPDPDRKKGRSRRGVKNKHHTRFNHELEIPEGFDRD